MLPTNNSSPVLLTDRTTMETDNDCERKGYWYKDYLDGKGIVPKKEASYFKEGRIVHHDLSQIAMGTPWQDVVAAAGEAPQGDILLLEPWLRRIGWVTAFGTWQWPALSKQYDVVKVEWELVLQREKLWVATTPDLLLRDKVDGKLVIIDYKSVGIMGKGWLTHWPYAIQMHILLKALEEEMGEKPKFAQVIGLTKGQETGGKLRHPYVWAYSDGGNNWSEKWKSGWETRLTSEYPGGVSEFVKFAGEEIGRGQFPMSAPIFLDERLLDRLLAQQLIRTQDRVDHRKVVHGLGPLTEVGEAILDTKWRQNFDKCRPAFGSECPYLMACHNAEVNRDPVGSGEYVIRTPHHDLEIIGVDNE